MKTRSKLGLILVAALAAAGAGAGPAPGVVEAGEPAKKELADTYFVRVFEKYQEKILKAAKAGEKKEVEKLTDEFNTKSGGAILFARVSRLTEEKEQTWEALINKTYQEGIKTPAIKYGSGGKPHVTRLKDQMMDCVLIESGQLEKGGYAEGIFVTLVVKAEGLGGELGAAETGKVRVALVDGTGKGAAGIEVRMEPADSADQQIVRGVTDGEGKVELAGREGNELTWRETLVVQRAGMEPQKVGVEFFAGAEVEQRVELEKVTVIRVVGPQGKGVAGAGLAIGTSQAFYLAAQDGEMHTDENGVYRWQHGALPAGVEVEVLGRKVSGEDAGEITISLTAEEVARVGKRAVLEGKLLLADGKAAAGWQVGEHVRFTGSMGFISGALLSENVTNCYAAERLVKVGPEGGFRLAGAGESLLAVSPEGVAFLYPLNPGTWEEGVVRKVTLRLPEVRREIRGQLVDEAGKGLSGVEIWAYAMRSGGRGWQYSVTGDEGKKDVGRMVTDAAGNYVLPVYWGAAATQYQAGAKGRLEWYGAREISAGGRLVLKSYAAGHSKPENFKNVTVLVVDERVEGAGDGAVEMGAARGLTARVAEKPDGRGGYERSEVFVRLTKLSGMERRALVRTLVWDLPWGGGGIAPVWMKMQRDEPGARVLEDLPVGVACEIEARSEGRAVANPATGVVMEAGAGLQEVRLEGDHGAEKP